MANIKIVDKLLGDDFIADYVIKSGSNYRKWNSGILEQWGRVDLPDPITTPIGSGFRGSKQVTFPIAFINNVVTVVVTSQNYAMSSIQTPSNSGFTLLLMSFDMSRKSDRGHWLAIGRWK